MGYSSLIGVEMSFHEDQRGFLWPPHRPYSSNLFKDFGHSSAGRSHFVSFFSFQFSFISIACFMLTIYTGSCIIVIKPYASYSRSRHTPPQTASSGKELINYEITSQST